MYLTYAYLCSLASWLLMLVNVISFLASCALGLALLVVVVKITDKDLGNNNTNNNLSFYQGSWIKGIATV